MRLIEAIRSALSAIATNTLRSLLTMLGIVIGVAAVIAMVAIGAGARHLVDTQIRSLARQPRHRHPRQRDARGARLGAGAASSLRMMMRKPSGARSKVWWRPRPSSKD